MVEWAAACNLKAPLFCSYTYLYNNIRNHISKFTYIFLDFFVKKSFTGQSTTIIIRLKKFIEEGQYYLSNPAIINYHIIKNTENQTVLFIHYPLLISYYHYWCFMFERLTTNV